MSKAPLILFALAFLFSGCLTQKKVNTWLDDHKAKAATYCHTNFPVDTLNTSIFKYVDSNGYKNVYTGVAVYADSLLWKLDSITRVATPDKPYKPNIDSLRTAIDKEIRKRLKPCIDSVVYIKSTVIDHAREAMLQGLNDEKDAIVTGQQKTIQQLTEKTIEQRKWFWLFWGLVALNGLYVFAKIRFKLPF